ncbi:MAG: hypothetical protein Q7J29_11990 [Stagnimonas sp.]|nr:hypothetical protein [Stagnimonas sp.]
MLLSLISVLVLLVIAFYALWVGTMGRVSGNEGAELSLTGRVVVFGIALVAFGVAYAVYSQPQYETETVATAPATPSTPPESRGGTVAETGDEGETVKPAPANSSDSAIVRGAEVPEAADTAQPTLTTAARPAVTTETDDDDQGLSAGAALLEAQARQPRRQPAAPFQAADEAPVRIADASVEKPTRADSPRTAKSASRVSTRTQRNPLLLHVHNRLGRDQLSEQLTLIIEGRPVADIAVDGSRPAVAVTVPLPRPGLLHYRLEGVSEQDGTTQLVGEGCIRVRDGARFAVRRKDGSRKVYLEATRAAG